jgi:hypothetical protein
MAAGDIKIIANEGYVDNKVSVVDSKVDVVSKSSNPFSGYMEYTKKADNFVFEESKTFAGKVGDKNRYLHFNGDMVDTYGPELVTNGVHTHSDRCSVIQESATRFKLTVTDLTYQSVWFYITPPTNIGSVYKLKWSIRSDKRLNKDVIELKDYSNKNYYIAHKTVGEHTFTLLDTGISSPIRMMVFAGTEDMKIGDEIVVDLSVREIQTADLSDKIPDVTVQDQATNGLTTQSDVSAGDYVVLDREELVTNGTFDSGTSGWGNTNYNSTDNRGVLLATGTEYAYPSTPLTTIIGKDYILKVTLYGTANNANIRVGTASVGIDIYSSGWSIGDGEHIIRFTATSTTSYIAIGVANDTIEFDNISVKQVDESFRAIQDAPAGTELTDAEYFENRDQQGIYNQAAVLHKYDPSTKTYLGMVPEVLFNEMLATETPKQFMTKNGFSVIDEGVYSKNGFSYVVAGVWNS